MSRCLLLDIEGTTCPISFVSDVLFPYAQTQLECFLQQQGNNPAITAIVNEAWHEWDNDPDPKQQALLQQVPTSMRKTSQAVVPYLRTLIQEDRKSTALKELQGHIWRQGFEEGIIKADFYPEAIHCLQQWKQLGWKLAVYSSGSVQAQQLLYGHTQAGDLRWLFCAWFDTRTGNKKDQESYRAISEKLKIKPAGITFISDNGAECDAAAAAGLNVLFSLRSDNPDQDPRAHRAITSLNQVVEILD